MELEGFGRMAGAKGAMPQKNEVAVVVGVGRSGLALLSHLRSRGVITFAYDKSEAGREALLAEGLGEVPLLTGEDYRRLPSADFVFRSPGVRPDHPVIRYLQGKGARLCDEITYFAALCPASIVAVTGSDGKSTTASLIAAAIQMAGKKAFLGGNIGRSLLWDLPLMQRGDYAVLELSSFQLMTADLSAISGVITNLAPNHLNWHTDMAEYKGAKERLFSLASRMTVKDGVFPAYRATRFSLDKKTELFLQDGVVYDREEPLFHTSEVSLVGRFHLENLMAAAGATRGVVPRELFSALAREFRGLPHRLSFVARRRGIDFYNSSIDTSPERTVATLTALAERGISPVVLLGGAEKGLSFAPLPPALRKMARGAVLFGGAREAIAKALDKGGFPYTLCADMEEAIFKAINMAEGGAVLLSPACTAFDAFRDYAERGEVFTQIVLRLSDDN
ncbi:MAG: UDP-N-acetylmuramoyl-L-alanine--D-glutamate ligase [Clostridia bacterium]|nr:UDP-N-acetylmuramoyl-L-alanine--D-glutamate ligase [Clostridia bacterium]